MNTIKKSVVVVGQILGLISGSKFETPVNYVLEQNPFISLY